MAAKKKTINPGPGAPSKYRPEYCQKLVDHMTTGLSFESFGATIGVHRDTLYEWTTQHPEFSDAKRRAVDACLLFYEKVGIGGMMGKVKGFQQSAWIFSMKARFRWRENDGSDGPEQDDSLKNALAALDEEEARKEEAAKKRARGK